MGLRTIRKYEKKEVAEKMESVRKRSPSKLGE